MRFEVETNQVSSAVTRAQELLGNITNERAQMFQAVEELNGMWVGEAHDVFAAQCTADNAEMEQLLRELNEIVEKFGSAKRAYESCESSAVEMVTALQV